jgi:type IV pilus assembly protein PilV
MDRLTTIPSAGHARRRRGMTLVEVMIAIVLLAIGLLSMLALQMQAMRGSQLGRHYTEAAQVARDEMDRLQQLPWGHADLAPTAWTALANEIKDVQKDGEANSVVQTYQFQRRVTADPVAGADVRMIDVRVTWYEANDDPGLPPRRRYAITSSRFNDE